MIDRNNITISDAVPCLRGELEEFTEIWHKAIDYSLDQGDFEELGKFLLDDCVISWCVPGIKPSFFDKQRTAVGPEEIVKQIEKNHLFGIPGWKRPWDYYFVDSRKGVILYFWKEISPYKRSDGTLFSTRTTGTTRIHYGGNYQIQRIEIVEDPEYRVATIDELIAAGLAPGWMIREQEEYYRHLDQDKKMWADHLEELERRRDDMKIFQKKKNPENKNQLREVVPEKAVKTNENLRMNDAKARAEHEAVRNRVGYYDFTHKLLEVTGIDARSFLSRMFVGAVAKAKIGQAKYTTMLNEKGIIIDDVIVFRIEEDKFWVSTLYIDELIAWFDGHKKDEDVEYQEITPYVTMYAVQGPASRGVLNAMLSDSISDLKNFHIVDNMIGDIPVKIARSGYTGELGYEIYCDPENAKEIEEELERAGRKYGIVKITTDVIVTSLPREKGFVLMSDLAGSNPLEAGFGWSIDWNKRFIGKEALARVKANGPERNLLGFMINDPAAKVEPGDSVIVRGQNVGKVTMFTYGFTLEKNIGFAMVNANIGDEAIIRGAKEYKVTLCNRVFYDPGNERVKEKNIASHEENAMTDNGCRNRDQGARKDHETVRSRVGYYDFTHQLLEVSGIDARSFLSRMFVAAISKLKVGRAKYTTMLNEQGVIIDDVIVFRMDHDKYWISTLYINEMIKWFDRYKTWQDVNYRDITNETRMYAVQGPKSAALLNDMLSQNINHLKSFQIEDNQLGSTDVKIARSGYTGELGYEIYCRPQDGAIVENALEKYGAKYGIGKITTDVIVTSLPREKGFVLMSDLAGTNPLEVGFDWTVDWDKEFIGKDALLKVKRWGAERRLVGFMVDDDRTEIAPGDTVNLFGYPVGKVTMYTYGFTVGKYIGYALVDAGKAAIDSIVEINGVETVLCDRVFYDPEGTRMKLR